MKWKLSIVLLAIPSALGASAALGIRWNLSPSVDPGLYRQHKQPPKRGDLVTVCLPEPVGRWARGRGYLGRGRCPGGSTSLGKWIAAVEGDLVAVKEKEIAVNGRKLEGSRRIDRDSTGRPVPLVPEGKIVLGPGEVWLHSGRRARSLDSRIFGPFEIDQIQAVLEPLLTLGER